MKIVYRAGDGTEFGNASQAEKYESITRKEFVIEKKEVVKLIPESELKNIFAVGSVANLSFYLKDEDGDIDEDGYYETNNIDDLGHLSCTDYEHGLLEWSEEDNSYYRIVHGHAWKVEFLGISKVSYY